MEKHKDDWFEQLDELDDIPTWANWMMTAVALALWFALMYWWLA